MLNENFLSPGDVLKCAELVDIEVMPFFREQVMLVVKGVGCNILKPIFWYFRDEILERLALCPLLSSAWKILDTIFFKL